MTAEWNADAYHRVSAPQVSWGLDVLERLVLRGDETVLDAGCGTGRLTRALVERLPRGRVVALDRSLAMLRGAQATLAGCPAVAVVQADAAALPLRQAVDAVFSTATFHWVLDHDRLAGELFGALRPGGVMVAQCGGAGNLDRFHGHLVRLMDEPAYRPCFEDWSDPWHFAGPADTERRLREAGFVDVGAWLEPRPTRFDDAGAFAAFVETVVMRPWLSRLPEGARRRFVQEATEVAAADSPALTLDYVRLNVEARRP